MPRAEANGIELEYESFGDPHDPALLLIMGLGAQLLSWNEELCEMLAGAGFHVIRFDNRDSGLSSWMDAAGPPDIAGALAGRPKPAYSLDELAADAVGLLDALGIAKAHIAGASMGGYLAQLVAINHPERVLTLTSIMSGPARDEGVAPKPEGVSVLIVRPPSTRDERIEQAMEIRRTLIGPADPFDEAEERRRAERDIDRAYHPIGTGRQLVSIMAAHPRLDQLRRLTVPVLVVHGEADVLIPVENGRIVAGAIPGARLIEFEGMGHDLPRRIWPQLVDAIAELARQASATWRASATR